MATGRVSVIICDNPDCRKSQPAEGYVGFQFRGVSFQHESGRDHVTTVDACSTECVVPAINQRLDEAN